MQISVETMSGLERRLTISVPSETFETQITQRLDQAAGQVRIPGFRPGRVPLKEVRRRYGPAVRAEVAGEIMQSSFLDAVRSEDLAPAGSPSLEVVKMDPGLDFEFTATFEVFPSVELTELSRVTLVRPGAQITDDDVQEMVSRLREQRKTWVDVERGADEGDKVTLDFAGFIDGEAFEGGSGEDMSFEVGGGQMIADFDRGVRGLSSGEAGEFEATFPDDYQSEELRGRTAAFKVTLKQVEASQLPELDDEFFKAFGVEEGGLEAFHADIRENMQREMDAAINNQVKSQVMDQLHKLHNLQLPGAMVAREIESLKGQMMQQFQMYGQQSPPDINLPDEMFTEQAERRVAVGLIVNELVSSAELTPDEKRVKERIETMAAGYADPEQVVNYYYGDPEQLQQIEMAVLEDQVVDHILEQANVEDLDSTYSDVISGAAVPAPEDDDAGQEKDGGGDASGASIESATAVDDDFRTRTT